MQQLLQSWKESLLLFKPINFKPLLSSTVKSVLETYTILFRYFWWLMAIYVVAAYFFPYPVDSYYRTYPLFVHTKNYTINWIVELFFIFIVFLAARPSTMRKNYAYFKQYGGYFIPFLGWGVLLSSFVVLIRQTGANFSGPFGILIGAVFYSINGAIAGLVFIWLLLGEFLEYIDIFIFVDLIIAGLMTIWLFPLMIFFVLFLLDAHVHPKFFVLSAIRALKMTWYNYPFCFIVHTVFVVIMACLNMITRYFLSYSALLPIHNFGIILLAPIPICFFVNFYSKRVKEQHKIYFEEKPSMWE